MAKRRVTYLSNEQDAVFAQMVSELEMDEAELIRTALSCYLKPMLKTLFRDDVVWPDNDPVRGGKREGAGRPPKQGGTED